MWNTGDELAFLKDLKKNNPEAFEGYRNSIGLRVDWGNIDRKAIDEFLKANPPPNRRG